ncbi:hypothetical protein Anapl_06186 [Anas platyrhynchos]|uniref:Uncharacterized protein n=1 Tax=Anas platyrhynchos TaxID=8839 RepID=R0KF07_ANAPL|nr:hypothetical protein Anapl_06186 [Anas platyrhynchos]
MLNHAQRKCIPHSFRKASPEQEITEAKKGKVLRLSGPILTMLQFIRSDPSMPQIQMSLISRSSAHKPVVKHEASDYLQGIPRNKAPQLHFQGKCITRMVQQWDSEQQPLLVAQEAQRPPKLQTKLLSCCWFAQSHVPVSFV